MKKFVTIVLSLCTAILANAQTLNIQTDNITYQFAASWMGDGVYSDATTLSIKGKVFNLTDIDKMYVDNSEITENTVSVTYSSNSASVVVAGNIAQYLTITTNGAQVSIIQSELVDDVIGKISYTLAGTSSNGGFYFEGSYKIDLILNGLTLTNPTGPAINIQDGKKINLTVKAGTTNTLTDGSNGDWKGCFVSKGHTEIKGGGTLNITGKTANAFWGKEFLELKNSTLNILGAVGDGVNVNQHFSMESGTLNISGVGDDGLQVSYETDDYGNIISETDNTGAFTITGGTIDITTSANGSKGIKAEGAVTISELANATTINVKTTGGTYLQANVDTAVCVCLKSETSINITGGTITLTSTGQGGRAMTCDKTINISGGTTTARAEGTNYGSSSSGGGRPGGGGGRPGDNSSSNGKNAKGVKAKGAITVTGGVLNVYSANHEGLESKSTITITGGEVYAQASDDAVNAAGDFTISDGYICSHSTSNDGLDANGNCYIKGGLVYAIGATSPEVAIDANTEQQKKLYVQGGTLVAIGGLESGSSLTQSCYKSSSWSKNTWYGLTVGSTSFAFKTPSSGGSTLVVSGASTPTLKSGVSASGTSIFGGTAYYPATISGGSTVSLSSYSSSGGGWGW